MGSANSCEKCDPSSMGSVVNLSDDCVDRLVGDEAISNEETKAKLVIRESSRMEKMRCIDDAHSASYGLTPESFEALCQRVEKWLKHDDELPCTRTNLIECLHRNPKCLAKCKEYMQEYIECVDLHRINRIKAKIEEERRESRKQEVNKLLNSSAS